MLKSVCLFVAARSNKWRNCLLVLFTELEGEAVLEAALLLLLFLVRRIQLWSEEWTLW